MGNKQRQLLYPRLAAGRYPVTADFACCGVLDPQMMGIQKKQTPNKTVVFRGFTMEPAIGFEPMTS